MVRLNIVCVLLQMAGSHRCQMLFTFLAFLFMQTRSLPEIELFYVNRLLLDWSLIRAVEEVRYDPLRRFQSFLFVWTRPQ